MAEGHEVLPEPQDIPLTLSVMVGFCDSLWVPLLLQATLGIPWSSLGY